MKTKFKNELPAVSFRLRAFLAVGLFCVSLSGAFGQTQTPEQAARSFYRWYLTELNADRRPVQQKRLMRQKVSARLGKWLYSKEHEENGFDADYFLDMQDWDRTWVNGITAERTSPAGSEVKVSLRAKKSSPFGLHVLYVRMTKENGVWKIDRVENRKTPE